MSYDFSNNGLIKKINIDESLNPNLGYIRCINNRKDKCIIENFSQSPYPLLIGFKKSIEKRKQKNLFNDPRKKDKTIIYFFFFFFGTL